MLGLWTLGLNLYYQVILLEIIVVIIKIVFLVHFMRFVLYFFCNYCLIRN